MARLRREPTQDEILRQVILEAIESADPFERLLPRRNGGAYGEFHAVEQITGDPAQQFFPKSRMAERAGDEKVGADIVGLGLQFLYWSNVKGAGQLSETSAA